MSVIMIMIPRRVTRVTRVAQSKSAPDAAQLGDTGTSNRYADYCVLRTNLPRIYFASESHHGGSSETTAKLSGPFSC